MKRASEGGQETVVAKYHDPHGFLPLSPLTFQVLLSLADAGRHGYGIILEIANRTSGMVTIPTGTLYVLLRRMVANGLIEQSHRRPRPNADDDRRRYYVLTVLGRAVGAAEASRLQETVRQARNKHLLRG